MVPPIRRRNKSTAVQSELTRLGLPFGGLIRDAETMPLEELAVRKSPARSDDGFAEVLLSDRTNGDVPVISFFAREFTDEIVTADELAHKGGGVPAAGIAGVGALALLIFLGRIHAKQTDADAALEAERIAVRDGGPPNKRVGSRGCNDENHKHNERNETQHDLKKQDLSAEDWPITQAGEDWNPRPSQALPSGWTRSRAGEDKTRMGTTERIERSAEVLKESAREQADSADRRTELAANRTVLASERTYAAWVRTGIATLASGLGAKALLADHLSQVVTGAVASIFVTIAGLFFGVAIWRLYHPGATPPTPDVPQVAKGLLAGICGVLLAVVALGLFVVWAT